MTVIASTVPAPPELRGGLRHDPLGYRDDMRTIAQAQGEWDRSPVRRLGDTFAFGTPSRRSRSAQRLSWAPAGELLAGRPADLPPVWLAVARLGLFLGALAVVVSFGMYVVIHAIAGLMGGFLGGAP